MGKKDISEYKKKYQTFRHHAWAGLGFLTVLLAVRIIVPSLSELILPILVVLIIYVVIALLFTYKYRAGLPAEEKVLQVQPSVEFEKERIQAKVEKERLKLEKKKAKTEAKKAKKPKK